MCEGKRVKQDERRALLRKKTKKKIHFPTKPIHLEGKPVKGNINHADIKIRWLVAQVNLMTGGCTTIWIKYREKARFYLKYIPAHTFPLKNAKREKIEMQIFKSL